MSVKLWTTWSRRSIRIWRIREHLVENEVAEIRFLKTRAQSELQAMEREARLGFFHQISSILKLHFWSIREELDKQPIKLCQFPQKHVRLR